MNSKKIIDVIENNISFKNRNNRIEIDSLLDVIPGSAEIDFANRVVVKEFFEPKDEEEKEYFIEKVKNLLDIFLIDYRDFITLIYGQLEAYISEYIDNKKMYNEFKTRFNKEYENRGEIYKITQYLLEKQEIQLSSKETKIIEFIDAEIRPKRNDLTHKNLPFSEKEYAEKILNSVYRTSLLQKIELEHKYNKDTVLWIIKQFFNTIDNKIA